VGETRLPAACALASLGVTTAEIPAIRVRDLFLDHAALWAHGGGTRTQARWVDLDEWSVDALRRRVADLAATRPVDGLLDASIVYTPMTATARPQNRQAAAAVTLSQVLQHAGLSQVAGVRPRSPSTPRRASGTRRNGWRPSPPGWRCGAWT
jgi:integrase